MTFTGANRHYRENDCGEEFYDGTCWMNARDTCQHCREERESAGLPYRWADERHSFGIYAGRYCDKCWLASGYRDATDPTAEFDPYYAGERLEEDS